MRPAPPQVASTAGSRQRQQSAQHGRPATTPLAHEPPPAGRRVWTRSQHPERAASRVQSVYTHATARPLALNTGAARSQTQGWRSCPDRSNHRRYRCKLGAASMLPAAAAARTSCSRSASSNTTSTFA
eukprot:351853-Chlamydomonas_euryale.AAC.7